MADNAIKNPLTITEKSQHEWATYKSNYSIGNPIESKKTMSDAFRFVEEIASSCDGYKERKEKAKEYGINIRMPSPNIDLMINGFGCKHNSKIKTK
jgi:uncharacterized protein with ATP-grasp and redox domains